MSAAQLPATLPGPPPMPVFGWRGNLMRLLRDPLPQMEAIYTSYGPLAALAHRAGTRILAIGPTYNQQLLSDAELFYSALEEITPERVKRYRTGIGLLSMNGVQHKQQRRLMLPAFHRKQIEGYRDDMVGIVQEFLRGWRSGQTLDVAQEMQQITLRIACKTLFGLDMSERAEGVGLLVKRWLQTPFFSPDIALFPFNLPGTPFRRLVKIGRQLDQEILAMVARKRAAGGSERDVLTMLIAARDEDGTAMSDAEMLGQTLTLLIAGHETSSNALAWTLLLLAQHPAVLDEVTAELAAILQGAPPAVEQLGRLPVLDRVIKESMRLLPPAPVGSRISTGPFEMGGYHFPTGTIVTFSQYLTHRLPELYHEPLRFLPERWQGLNPSPYEYLPFGAGPRMCIGASFAMMEIKLVLAMLLQAFRLQVVPESVIDTQVRITMSPKHGLPMTIVERDQPLEKVAIRGTIHHAVLLT